MTYLIKEKKFSDIWSKKMTIPIPTIDVVIFTIYLGEACVVLLKAEESSYLLPGGVIARGFDLETNCDNILERKTGIKKIYKEQLYTFGNPNRDKRGHTISIIFLALISTDKFLSSVDLTKVTIMKYSDIEKINLGKEKIGYDHKEIILYAKQRLRWKLEYTNIAKDMLGKTFRISELQEVYEIILNKKIDKRNFQKKIFKLKMIKETGTLDRTTNRPAKLYKFVDKELKIYEIM